MSEDTCRVLLRNGQSIDVSGATPLESEIQFVSAVRLTLPQSAWLQRTSDGSMIEIAVTSATPEAAGWRYRAELASLAEGRTQGRVSSWGLFGQPKKN